MGYAFGVHTNTNSLSKGATIMGNLTRYHAANLPELMEKINRNSIGLDDYLDRFFSVSTQTNYPPYNLIQLNNHESKLEIALAGFKKDEIKVYTEFGKLHVEGKKKRNQQLMENFSTKDWPNAPLNGSGRSPMIRRLDPSSLKMDFSPW